MHIQVVRCSIQRWQSDRSGLKRHQSAGEQFMTQDASTQSMANAPALEMEANRHSHSQQSPVDRITAVGRGLSRTLQKVLGALTAAPGRPNELAAYLDLNRDIAGRVLRASALSNPLQVANVVPGPEPLRRFARAAARRGVDRIIVDEAIAAIDRFDRLIRDEAGTRAGLNAIISASVPVARERFEIASRQAAFKGMSQLRGVSGELWLSSTLVWPASDPMHHDVVMLHGSLGMQRLRPDAMVKFTYRDVVTAPETTEKDVSDEANRVAAPMAHFLTNPPAQLDARRIGQITHHILRNTGVGPQSAVDMLAVDQHSGAWDRYADPSPPTPGRTKKSIFVAPGIPSQNLLFDVFCTKMYFRDRNRNWWCMTQRRTGSRGSMIRLVIWTGWSLMKRLSSSAGTFGELIARMCPTTRTC